MYIAQCPKNIRCDVGSCHKFAKYNINTSSYKGNFCLCEDCFKTLYSNIQKTLKEEKLKK